MTIPGIARCRVFVPRYGLTLTPFENFAKDSGRDPDWWVGYSRVKHNRDRDFTLATLHNALNSVAALLILLMYFYMRRANPQIAWMQIAEQLEPQPALFRPENTIYRQQILR
jgi:hypothetical protein